MTKDFVGKASVITALTTVARRFTLCECWDRSEKRHFESALAFKAPAIVHAWSATTKQTVQTKQCEFVDVGGGHKALLLLRRMTIQVAQAVVKTMDLFSGNLTAAVVNLGNHLQTAIQCLHIRNSQSAHVALGRQKHKFNSIV